jgi:hypothetical protein
LQKTEVVLLTLKYVYNSHELKYKSVVTVFTH